MPLRHFLTYLDSDEYQTLEFLMFPHQEHVWFIGSVFHTLYLTCALSMLWSCIADSNLLHIPLLPLSYIDLYLAHPSMSSLLYVLYHFVFVLGLSFIFSFILHPSCIIIIVRTFISYLHFSLTLCLFLTKRGNAYPREYTEVFCYFYMTLVLILRRRNSISHVHL